VTSYDSNTLAQLWEGRLPPEEVRKVQSRFKDRDRFWNFLQYCQERVAWNDRILLPLQPHLFVVQTKDGRRVIKCSCGHEFCSYRDNWKMEACVAVRDSDEALQEIYPPLMHADPAWMELREFTCPGCHTQLEVELAPPGYPILHDFQPDLEVFWRDWLGKELPKP